MLEFDRSLAIIVVLVLVFVWVLKRTLLIPLLGIIGRREEKMNSAREAMTQSKGQFTEREKEYRRQILSARREAALIREKEQQAAYAERDSILSDARGRAENKQHKFAKELEGQLQQLKGALGNESQRLSESICRLLLEP